MKKVFVIIFSLLVFGCSNLQNKNIENKRNVSFFGQKDYIIQKGKKIFYWNGKDIISVGRQAQSVAFGTNTAALIIGGKLYFLALTNQLLSMTESGRGQSVDYSGGFWLVKQGRRVGIYSNERKISFINLLKNYDKIALWKGRMVLTLANSVFGLATIQASGLLSGEDKMQGVIDFALNPTSPEAYIARNTNELIRYQLYSGQKQKIDTFPAAVLSLKYNPEAHMLIVRGKGIIAFYFLNSGRIQMVQMYSDAVSYRDSDKQLLVLTGDKLVSFNFTDKSTNIIIGLPKIK